MTATPPPDFPWYVRVMAVFHVLSLLLGPFGFFVLGAIAVFLWVRHGMDGWVIGLGLSGIGWLLFCNFFRWWFVRWGRKHWPEPSSVDSSEQQRFS